MAVDEKAPALAGAEASKTHSEAIGTQIHNNLILFPLHYRRNLLTLSERCAAWRSIRCPRGSYQTPLPEDFKEMPRG